jgi:lipoprotein-releasing system ATP-binding protein
MLQARNLTKRYGTLTVLKDVSLHIKEGEVVSITGPSGAGKSTLLHLLGALDRPDEGSVLIRDTDVMKLSARKVAAFRNKNLGFVFQAHHLLPEFTAAENVAMPLWIGGMGKAEGIRQGEELLGRVGLSARKGHKPSQLSGGEQQRVAIARALALRPAVLFADEPTGNLDTANAESIHTLFLDLRRQTGQTIVFITHNEALATLTDRTLMMLDGRIVEERRNKE